LSKISVVTGAAGHIGYALVLELLARGERPRLLLWLPEEAKLFEGMDCEIVYGDITKPETLLPCFEGAGTVYHLAGLVDIGNADPNVVMRVNVDGTQNVIAACKARGVRRLVYCSSVDAMPPAPEGAVMREIEHFGSGGVTGAYAKSKAIATQAALGSAGPDFEVAVAMPAACIGPYEFKASSVGEMVRMFLHGRFPVTMRFGGYNFVDIRDVAQGLAACGDPAKAPSGSRYILAGEYVRVDEFITMLAELTGQKPPAIPLPYALARMGAPIAKKYYDLSKKTPLFTPYTLRKLMDNGQFDCSKAMRELDYHPRSARKSLEDMINWIREYERSPHDRTATAISGAPLPPMGGQLCL